MNAVVPDAVPSDSYTMDNLAAAITLGHLIVLSRDRQTQYILEERQNAAGRLDVVMRPVRLPHSAPQS